MTTKIKSPNHKNKPTLRIFIKNKYKHNLNGEHAIFGKTYKIHQAEIF